MKKVNGANVTINQLKKWYFGYSTKTSFDKMVNRIIVNGLCYTTDEENNIFCFPIDYLDDFAPPRFCKTEDDFEITIYDFIRNYWDLDEYNLEDFEFYFSE